MLLWPIIGFQVLLQFNILEIYFIILVNDMAYFIANYMETVSKPCLGYRAKKAFRSENLTILSNHPARPELYSLSPLYAGEHAPLYKGVHGKAWSNNQFPGEH